MQGLMHGPTPGFREDARFYNPIALPMTRFETQRFRIRSFVTSHVQNK